MTERRVKTTVREVTKPQATEPMTDPVVPMEDDLDLDTELDPEQRLQAIVDQIREKSPEIGLFQIVVPDDDEIYIAKKVPWKVYKQLLGRIKDEAQANETLVERFMVHPRMTYESVQDLNPGTVMVLAGQIQKGLGFSKEASLKNL